MCVKMMLSSGVVVVREEEQRYRGRRGVPQCPEHAEQPEGAASGRARSPPHAGGHTALLVTGGIEWRQKNWSSIELMFLWGRGE